MYRKAFVNERITVSIIVENPLKYSYEIKKFSLIYDFEEEIP